jgi:hypothetical protein
MAGVTVPSDTLIASPSSLDMARDDPEHVEGSKDERCRSWFDALTAARV